MREKRLIIVGGGGHGRVIADIARLNGYEDIAFLDDAKDIGSDVAGYPVIGRCADYTAHIDEAVFVAAIGHNATRKAIQCAMMANGARFVTLIHPAATVARDVTIGKGTVVMAGAVINPGATIGDGVIVNTSCSVDHDCVIDEYVHISVGAHLAGTVHIGRETMIGAGAVVINNIEITACCVIGAGAVVIRSIEEAATYIGVPAKRLS